MNARESLPVGWRPGPFPSAALAAGVVMGAALAVHLAGLLAGASVLAGALVLMALSWNEGWIDGSGIRLRSLRTGLRARGLHARSIDGLVYRRGFGPPRLRLANDGGRVVLVACGPDARAPAFRRSAMWLLVHGRRQARIDPALVDALAAMPDHVGTGQPHDASHA